MAIVFKNDQDEEVGRVFVKEDKVHFEGNADETFLCLIEELQPQLDAHLKEMMLNKILTKIFPTFPIDEQVVCIKDTYDFLLDFPISGYWKYEDSEQTWMKQ